MCVGEKLLTATCVTPGRPDMLMDLSISKVSLSTWGCGEGGRGAHKYHMDREGRAQEGHGKGMTDVRAPRLDVKADCSMHPKQCGPT